MKKKIMLLFNKLLQLIKPMKKISFDWKFYIETHKDLREAGIDTEEKAIAHWKKFGRREGRIYCVGTNTQVPEVQLVPEVQQDDSQLLKLEPVVEPTPEPVVEPTPEPVVVEEKTEETEEVEEGEETEEVEEGEETEEVEEGEETEYEEEEETEEEEEEFDDKENVVEREIVIN